MVRRHLSSWRLWLIVVWIDVKSKQNIGKMAADRGMKVAKIDQHLFHENVVRRPSYLYSYLA
jgi:hypothetical protein